MFQGNELLLDFDAISGEDTESVGGKNASLGELIRALGDAGVRVPGGFATTAHAYWKFVESNDLASVLDDGIHALESDERTLEDVGRTIREAFLEAPMPDELAEAIRDGYQRLTSRAGIEGLSVAVRSSATAEDLPEASFAGQQESFLNIVGAQALIDACRRCFASLFTDRAIHYRQTQGFDHRSVALSVGVQQMVRSDIGSAGVMFSIDTETGFPDIVLINAAWGLGDTVVQGSVDPDEYRVFKPKLGKEDLVPVVGKAIGSKECKSVFETDANAKPGQTTKTIETSPEERSRPVLSDEEILTLGRWAVAIEAHYGRAMDMEWAKDGETDELFCVQARPETVMSHQQDSTVTTFHLEERGCVLVRGTAIGQSIAVGRARVLHAPSQMQELDEGDVLVTERTDPDWGPVMKRAAAIITDHGGRTSHAAIVSRELGLPAVIGTSTATRTIADGQLVTVSCAEGSEGVVYEGDLKFDRRDVDIGALPEAPVRLMINVASPTAALRWWRLPVRGVGLARMEFIITDLIKVHPLSLCRYEQIDDPKVRGTIDELTEGYEDKTEYFVDRLARGLATIAASQFPEPVIVRLSDFKTNEYATLIGGEQFEPQEANPMLGFRGASRYYSDAYRDGFEMECRAIVRARREMGLDNIVVMVPFVRTPEEADRVLEVMADHDLERGKDGLDVYMMCEVPSNVFLADLFATRFDGFSIGSNDLTQLTLGVDRDCESLRDLFDERNEAVKRAVIEVIDRAHETGIPVGICGQAPSDYPEFARFLLDAGIDSLSLDPASVVDVLRTLTNR